MINHRYLSRTAMTSWQRCPRKGYLGQVYGGRGISPKLKTSPLALGQSNHAGVEVLMKGLMHGVINVDFAVNTALGVYGTETERGLYGVPDRHVAFVRREHQALIEGAIRLYAAVRLPVVAEKYTILEVEEEHTIALTPSLTLISRPDAVFEDNFSGALDVFSLKNPGKFDFRKNKDATVDMQGLSESYAVAHDYPDHSVKGVMMEHIIVGKAKDVEVEDGTEDGGYPIQRSPLVRGWFNAATGELAWKYMYDNPNYDPSKPAKTGNFKQTTLSAKKGWSPIAGYDLVGGVEEWIENLSSGLMIPVGSYAANEIFEYPPPYIRRQEHIDEWLESTIAEQTSISERLASLEAGTTTLAKAFPKYSHACVYPQRCEFYDVCWKGHSPNDQNVFEQRTPHHAQELEDK